MRIEMETNKKRGKNGRQTENEKKMETDQWDGQAWTNSSALDIGISVNFDGWAKKKMVSNQDPHTQVHILHP